MEDWRFTGADLMGEDWKFSDEPDSFITADGREVKYLKNPLPGPKKHVARYMDFDHDIDEEDIRKFDQGINNTRKVK